MDELTRGQRLEVLKARRAQSSPTTLQGVPPAAAEPTASDPRPVPTPDEPATQLVPQPIDSEPGAAQPAITRREVRLRRGLPSGSRLAIGGLSGVGFVATAMAMGPVVINTDQVAAEAASATSSAEPTSPDGSAMADNAEPEVAVIANYIYVDADGNPLSEEEAAARLAAIDQATEAAAASDTTVDPSVVDDSTTVPAIGAPAQADGSAGAPAPKAAQPLQPTPPTAANPAPGAVSTAPAAPATPTPTATPAPTAAPAKPKVTTTQPPATTAPPPPPTTAPPQSGSSG